MFQLILIYTFCLFFSNISSLNNCEAIFNGKNKSNNTTIFQNESTTSYFHFILGGNNILEKNAGYSIGLLSKDDVNLYTNITVKRNTTGTVLEIKYHIEYKVNLILFNL